MRVAAISLRLPRTAGPGSASRRRAAALVPATLLAGAMLGGSAPAPLTGRVALPVRLVVLSDGTPRFGVPLTIAGQAVEAGLDTGSTGLRVMARALPAGGTGATVRYGYGSGTVLVGPEQTVSVGFGGASGPVRVQRVETVTCMPSRPRCPATRNDDPATFGIQSDGLPNEGFAAILGVNLRSAAQPNPFGALGARRWIVELPYPGGPATGRIILNPTADEMAGYRILRFGSDDNSLPTCLAGPAPLGRVCGPATIDSGAPGLRVVQAGARPPVPNGSPVAVTIGEGDAAVRMDVTTGRRDQGSRLTLEQRPGADATRLFLGVAPYYRFSILYDADARTIGFKPRQRTP